MALEPRIALDFLVSFWLNLNSEQDIKKAKTPTEIIVKRRKVIIEILSIQLFYYHTMD